MFKKLLYGMAAISLFAACTGDYDDWASPQSNEPEESKLVQLSATPAGDIDLASVTDESVAVATFAVTAPEGFIVDSVGFQFESDDATYEVPLTGVDVANISTETLAAVVADIYGRRPVFRTLNVKAWAYAWTSAEKTTRVASVAQTFTINVKPVAPVIEDAYYYIGSLGTDMSYPLSNGGGDVYDNPVFTITIPASGQSWHWFKIAPKSGFNEDGSFNWDNESSCVCATTKDDEAMEGKFVIGGDKFSWHLLEENYPDAKYYTISVNMLDQTYTITPINYGEYFYEIGGESSWSTVHALYGANADGKYQGYYYLNGEFKFKPNADNWDGDYEYDGEGKIADNGGSNCPDPGAGFYQIDVDLAAGTYALTKVNSISAIGDFNSWGGDVDLAYNTETGAWEATDVALSGGVKFRMNHEWAVSWGGADGDATNYGNLTQNNGQNLSVEAGTYDIQLFISYEGNNKVVFTKK